MNFYKKLAVALGAFATLLFGSVVYASTIPVTPAVFETYLANAEGTTDTSLTIANNGLRDGTNLSGYVCLTIDSNTSTLEYECGTDSAGTVSNLLRGIDATTGTTSVPALIFAHRRGADVKITDYPTLTIIQRILDGLDTLAQPIAYTSDLTQAQWNALSSTTIPDIAFVNRIAIAGAANSSETVNGISQLATGLQAASSTSVGSTGGRLVLGSNLATDTPSVPQSVSGSKVVISSVTGFIKQAWLDLSATWNFTGTIESTGNAFGFVPMFGDGSDSASTTAASYSLTRDEYFTNYTVSTGNTITTNGFRIFVTGTLTVNGTIDNSGGNGGVGGQGGDEASSGNGAQGTAGTAGAGTNGTTVAPSFAGTAGGLGSFGRTTNVVVGSSTAGTAATISFLGTNGSSGGAGGSGGNSTCGSGSNAGGTSATSTATLVQKPTNVFVLLTTLTSNTQLAAQPVGGAGGGGGCSNNTPTAAGGGGGGGGAGGDGGYIFIAAKTITIGASGVISANGGIGAAGGRGGNASGATGNVGGGGGGGGAGGDGGLIVLVYTNSYTNSGSVVTNAGTAGVGGAAGTGNGGNGIAGNTGNAGVAGIVKTIQI